MIVDAGGYLGNFPYRKLRRNTARELDEYASGLGITHMVVSSIDAVFFKDPSQGNDMLAETIKEYTGMNFIPFAVVNPVYPEWKDDAVRAVKEQGFKGFELCPHYHGYNVNDAAAKEALKLAKSLNVPVRISNGFENIRQRSRMDTFTDLEPAELLEAARNFSGVKFLFIGFNFYGPAEYACDNAYHDFSRLDVFDGVNGSMKALVSAITPERVILATFAPFQYIEPQLIKLRYIDLSEGDKNKILSSNLDFLF